MNESLFKDLQTSINEACEIEKGNKTASRSFHYSAPDIKSIREKINYSQSQFAIMIGVNTSTLQNWEQGRRTPTGPAQALLKLVDKAPELVKETLKM